MLINPVCLIELTTPLSPEIPTLNIWTFIRINIRSLFETLLIEVERVKKSLVLINIFLPVFNWLSSTVVDLCSIGKDNN
ncbi:hypothetical protein ZOD2009_09725 [Haladaptatus paucihalophilus DX253]|uniref:Uncharacterized protein n=1 Tax=Haladaptatus paucihalophilus DX253 TaxID=797209 RepID=E7QT45_HALPU|nr:hypothetical protein ZOD2009_09725 [Haladaptatus paucihalophilus DX253]